MILTLNYTYFPRNFPLPKFLWVRAETDYNYPLGYVANSHDQAIISNFRSNTLIKLKFQGLFIIDIHIKSQTRWMDDMCYEVVCEAECDVE